MTFEPFAELLILHGELPLVARFAVKVLRSSVPVETVRPIESDYATGEFAPFTVRFQMGALDLIAMVWLAGNGDVVTGPRDGIAASVRVRDAPRFISD